MHAVSVTGWPAGRPAGDTGWLTGDGGRGRSGRGRHTRLAAATLSGRGARVYTAHRDWLGVVTGISAALIGGVLVYIKICGTGTVGCDADTTALAQCAQNK